MKWIIVADSGCDLYRAEKECEDIFYKDVPFIITVDDEEFKDDEKLDTFKIFDAIKKSRKGGSTACASPDAWEERFEKDANILCITLSKNLSGSFNSAKVAAEAFKENNPTANIEVIDSCATGPAMVLAVRKAYKLINKEESFDDVTKKLKEYISGINTVFALSCFDNLIKSGRMSKLSGVLAASLDFRGIGEEKEGRINFKKKVRGKKKMIAAMIEDMYEKAFSGNDAVITHCCNEELAQKVSEKIKENWENARITIMPARGLNSYYAENGGLIISYM